MEIKTSTCKTLISVLILVLLNNIACLKHVSIPPESRKISSHNDVIYVYLKSSSENETMDRRVLIVKKPRFEDQYLIGESESRQISIPLDDIESIEVLKIDKKKVLIGFFILTTLTVIGYAYASAAGSASVD